MGPAEQKKRRISAYVRAYTYAYGTLWDERVYERVVELYRFLTQLHPAGNSHAIGFYLSCAYIADTVRREQLARLLQEHQLTELLGYLCGALFEKGDGLLLLPMMRALIEWYEDRVHIVHVEVSTAAPLSHAQSMTLAAWVRRCVDGADLRITYDLCPALLAGVRLETKQSVAEYSVRRQLGRLSQLCKHEDITWQ